MACNNSNLQQLFEIKLHPPIPVLLQNLLTMALFSHKVTLNSKVLTKLLTLRSREEHGVLMLITHLV
ncbi:hypothetical protein RYX36_019279 [Vicia faba]